jgi:hypothetical protein
MRRLSDVVTTGLEDLTVKSQVFLDRRSARSLLEADNVLPQNGTLRQALYEYLGEAPVFDFVFESLSRELYETQTYDSEKPPVKLRELDGYEDLRARASRLLEDFRSLPWQYALSLPLPNEIGRVLGSATATNLTTQTIRVITPNDAFSAEYPLKSGIEARDRHLAQDVGCVSLFGQPSLVNALALAGNALTWDIGTAHIQVYVNGFIGMYGTTTAMDNALDYVKSLLGLAIALRLFKVERSFTTSPSEAKCFVHRKIGDRWIIERLVELDTPLSTAIGNLVFDDHDGRIDSEEKQLVWAHDVFKRIDRVFSQEPRSRRLLLAAQWLFDSYCGSDDLLSFVQSAVALEILLGDKAMSDAMGLGELLRNRCAYSIGRTLEEREQILRDFPKIYGVRSEIVHAGKKRLNYQERLLHFKLRWICSRVVQTEAELFRAKTS